MTFIWKATVAFIQDLSMTVQINKFFSFSKVTAKLKIIKLINIFELHHEHCSCVHICS